MDLASAQKSFSDLLDKIDGNCTAEFLSWIEDSFTTKSPQMDEQSVGADFRLGAIVQDIRTVVPLNAVLPSETIVQPSAGVGSEFVCNNTVHVDAFLYDDDDIDELVEQGQLSRSYCLDCGSHKCAPLTFISHSISQAQIRYIFASCGNTLLGNGGRPGLLTREMTYEKVFLDVGSRLGAGLYGAYNFAPDLSQIIGVEINPELTKLQENIIQKHQMGDRISIINGDIIEQGGIIAGADIILMHNVFQFFVPQEHQIKCWKTLHTHCRPGTVIITIPSIEELTNHMTSLGFDLTDWLTPANTKNAAFYAGKDQDLFEDIKNISAYQVK